MPEQRREGTFGTSRVSAIKSVAGILFWNLVNPVALYSVLLYVNRRCGDFMFRVRAATCGSLFTGERFLCARKAVSTVLNKIFNYLISK